MVGTDEEALEAMARRDEEPADGLSDYDRKISGIGGKYLVLPYPNTSLDLKRMGEALKSLGTALIGLSNQHEIPHRYKVLDWRTKIDQTTRKLAVKGRKKHPWETGSH